MAKLVYEKTIICFGSREIPFDLALILALSNVQKIPKKIDI